MMSTIQEQIDKAEKRWLEAKDVRAVSERYAKARTADDMPNWTEFERRDRLVRRADQIGDPELAEAIVSDDLPEISKKVILERVIGKSQLEGVKFFELGMLAARAVCRIVINDPFSGLSGYGSGVLVGPGLLMTNNHVLGTEDVAAASGAQFDYLETANGTLGETVEFGLDPSRFFLTDETLDFTLVATTRVSIDGTRPVESRGWSYLIPGSSKALITERVNIIQHPGGERMQIAIRDSTVVAGEKESPFLHYRADTMPGSSGAPVHGPRWNLAALHHAGVPKRDAQGNILTVNGSRWSGRREDVHTISWIANEGVRISAIVSHVNRTSLSVSENELWQGSQVMYPKTNLWGLFDGDAAVPHQGRVPSSATEARENNSPAAHHDDRTGRTTWNFSLSFGPTGIEPDLTVGTVEGPRKQAPLADPRPNAASQRHAIHRTKSAADLAEHVLSQHRHEGPWYDGEEDADARDRYWAGFDWSGGAEQLYGRLQRHLETTHRPLTNYRKARWEFLYAKVDVYADGKLRNIYSGTELDSLDAITEEIQTVVAEATARGLEATDIISLEGLMEDESFIHALEHGGHTAFNCEHVVCQSWFKNDTSVPDSQIKHMRSDLHHLFTCEPACNSFRSNIPYYDFGPEDERVMLECGRREGKRFEPQHGKGLAARATMYFLLRYPGIVGDRRSEFTKSRIPIVTGWHSQYEVSDFERRRNWLIEKAQGNRNPFIDYPDRVTRALLEQGFG